MLYGYQEYVLLLASDASAACNLMEAIKAELAGNDLLYEDFPEVCYPVRCLNGRANRAKGQTYQKVRTQIEWSAGSVVLPGMPGSKASWAVIDVGGLTGGLRGKFYHRPDGRTVRPGLVILDDPQTRESSASALQCDQSSARRSSRAT